MKTIELSTALKPFLEYAPEFGVQPVVLTLNQQPMAVVVSLKQTDTEPFALSMNPEFIEIIEKARGEFRAGKKLSLEEMKQEVLNTSRK
jgi:hypothetical protein